MPSDRPDIVRWGDVPMDMISVVGRFKRSAFNAFYTERERGMAVGHWEVAEGDEDYGMFPQTEVLYIVEGRWKVQTDDSEQTVGPGDTVFAHPGRRMRLVVAEPLRVFYVTAGMEDIADAQAIRRRAAE